MVERDRDAVMVVGFAGLASPMVPRLIALGYRPISARDPEAAALRMCREPQPARAAIVPVDATFLELGALIPLARAAGPGGLRALAVGPRVPEEKLDALYRAGVSFTLWEPFTDRELRFVLNRALHDGARGQERSFPRVATDLVARVRVGSRDKAGLLYALSIASCYLETDRPCMPGSRVAVHLPLPGADVDAAARVVFANVPGDFTRWKLPRGMALEFVDLGPAQRRAISGYIEARLADHALAPARAAAPPSRLRGLARVWSGLRRSRSTSLGSADSASLRARFAGLLAQPAKNLRQTNGTNRP